MGEPAPPQDESLPTLHGCATILPYCSTKGVCEASCKIHDQTKPQIKLKEQRGGFSREHSCVNAWLLAANAKIARACTANICFLFMSSLKAQG
jgi:hypothetical protein